MNKISTYLIPIILGAAVGVLYFLIFGSQDVKVHWLLALCVSLALFIKLKKRDGEKS